MVDELLLQFYQQTVLQNELLQDHQTAKSGMRYYSIGNLVDAQKEGKKDA
jgi:hypothetical protein